MRLLAQIANVFVFLQTKEGGEEKETEDERVRFYETLATPKTTERTRSATTKLSAAAATTNSSKRGEKSLDFTQREQ